MKKSPIESPCISVCRYDNEVCVGCGRTVDDITNWYDMTDDEKQAVLNRIEKDSKGWFK
jgi:predicted Fe-S protein YdhL (DUF1289 family)